MVPSCSLAHTHTHTHTHLDTYTHKNTQTNAHTHIDPLHAHLCWHVLICRVVICHGAACMRVARQPRVCVCICVCHFARHSVGPMCVCLWECVCVKWAKTPTVFAPNRVVVLLEDTNVSRRMDASKQRDNRNSIGRRRSYFGGTD